MVGVGIHGVLITVTAIIISRFITEPEVMHTVTSLRKTTVTTVLEATIPFQTTTAPEQQTVALEHNKDIHQEIFDKTPIKPHVFTTSELQILHTINQIIRDLTTIRAERLTKREATAPQDTTTATLLPDLMVDIQDIQVVLEEVMAVADVQAEEEDNLKNKPMLSFQQYT